MGENEQWDPLSCGKEASPEVISNAQKREIRNILKSYVGMYDSFSELIQNAMDSVDRRAGQNENSDYQKKIWLTISLAKNSFSITDNGVGFAADEFKTFLAPNISFKDPQGSRGNKGVGATYLAYGFDFFQFGTKGEGGELSGELLDARTWVDDTTGKVARPMVCSTKELDSCFSS